MSTDEASAPFRLSNISGDCSKEGREGGEREKKRESKGEGGRRERERKKEERERDMGWYTNACILV